MPEPFPAISLVAVPGRRRRTLDIARDIERRGFSGIYMPSRLGNMAQCTGLAFATERIAFGTAIAPIYAQTPEEFAAGAAYIHEVSGGRFRFGIGVAHGPTHQRLGITVGNPLADTRAFVDKLKSYDGIGDLPPIVLAALRKRMVALAAEIAQGVLFANASLSHMAESLAVVPQPTQRPGFSGRQHAAGVHHRRRERGDGAASPSAGALCAVAELPQLLEGSRLREEMAAIEKAIAENRRDDIPKYLTDRWIADNSLYGSAAKVRDQLAAWYAAGVNTPVLVPNSVNGNQLTALDEIFSAFSR